MMKKLFIIWIFALVLLVSNAVALPFFNNTFTFRQEYNLTVNHTISDRNFINLTNVTVFLNFSTSSLISQGRLNSDCSDLRIIDGLTNLELNFEIEKDTCNSADGTALWIRIPILIHNQSQLNNIVIYYNSSVANPKPDQFSFDAWDARYAGVFHMNNASMYNSRDGTVGTPASTTTKNPNATMPLGNYQKIILPVSLDTRLNFPATGLVTNYTTELFFQPADNVIDRSILIGARNSPPGQHTGMTILGSTMQVFFIDGGQGTFNVASANPSESNYYTLTFQNKNPPTGNNGRIKTAFNGINIGGPAVGIFEYPITTIEINADNLFGGDNRDYTGAVDEVRIAFNFSTAISTEYNAMNFNTFTNNNDVWARGVEEQIQDTAPVITVSISDSEPKTDDVVSIPITCTDDFQITSLTIEDDTTGVFVQDESFAPLNTSFSTTHLHTVIEEQDDEQDITITHRITCTDDTGKSTIESVSYTLPRILPLQNILEVVGMIVLFFIILQLMFKFGPSRTIRK